MRNRLLFVSLAMAAILAVIVLTGQAYAATTILFQNKILTVAHVKTEIYIANGEKPATKLLVTGQDVSVRAFFDTFKEEVTWNNTQKIAIIKNDGKELLIPMAGNITTNKDQVVLPEGWTYFKNGKAYLKFPYLAYVFDRYAEFGADSEEYAWKQKLSFLHIKDIDTNNSAPKDQTIHSFVLLM